MLNKLKGFKTILLSLFTMLTGALVGAGLLTPELGAGVSASVSTAVSSFETLIGALQVLIGALIAAARVVTTTKIFESK